MRFGVSGGWVVDIACGDGALLPGGAVVEKDVILPGMIARSRLIRPPVGDDRSTRAVGCHARLVHDAVTFGEVLDDFGNMIGAEVFETGILHDRHADRATVRALPSGSSIGRA